MNQYPLIPFFNLFQADATRRLRRETEREIFERIARRCARTSAAIAARRTYARLRRIFGGGRGVAPGSRRVARNH